MSNAKLSLHELRASLADSLALLETHDVQGTEILPDEPLPSLLDQCQALVDDLPAPEPVRLIHHMACTGGSLISKLLGVMPNTVLLSEIDPLSRIPLPKPESNPRFTPYDLIYGLRVAVRDADDALVSSVFKAALARAHDDLKSRGQHLCIRVHSHSQYCTQIAPHSRPTVQALIAAAVPTLSVVTVRHPVDSYLSMHQLKWLHFEPSNADEYAKRYTVFLDDHATMPLLRYEDLVADPEGQLKKLCNLLHLPYMEGAANFISAVSISGDSGRRGEKIEARPRRIISDELREELHASKSMKVLCKRLGYEAYVRL